MGCNDYIVLNLKSTASTNDFVRTLSKSLKPDNPYVVVRTDYQTNGRGQTGNSWESEDGKNLLFSVLYRPKNVKAKNMFCLSQAIALSIKEVLSLYIKDVTIKWPNDIYWHDKKIAGILIENELSGKFVDSCIMGVGINVNQKVFLSDAPNPVSMIQIINSEIPVTELLELIMIRLKSFVEQIERGEYLRIETNYSHSLYRGSGYYEYEDDNGRFVAKVHNIEPNGVLVLLDTDGKMREYQFKEVRFIISNKKES